jgi:phospho-N-acetylmuramoyl-pentapeptide-transferase
MSIWPLLLAPFLALILTLILGKLLIPVLTRLRVGQNIRTEGPETHQKKAGTPTMGGLIFVPAILLTTGALTIWQALLFQPVQPNGVLSALLSSLGPDYNHHGVLWALLGLTVACFAIGLLDDILKLRHCDNLGLKASQKFLLQILVALGFVGFELLSSWSEISLLMIFPFIGPVNFGVFKYVLDFLIILAAMNGVNLTDGLDGLAAGCVATSAAAFAGIAIVINLILDSYDTQICGIFALAVMGGCLGFLFFNHYPAKVFMGDCGSLALGGALAGVAILTYSGVFLLIIGIVYVAETLSVILQVYFFKTQGRRLFLMSPLHHHYELKGWSEQKVVRRFSNVSLLAAVLGFILYFVSGLITMM